ncbi:MAG: ABC transporter substrate-binding protein [Candidatus Bathyarchaeia archaeon]
MAYLVFSKKAITKVQAVTIAIIIIIAVVAGTVYYCYIAAPRPTLPPKDKVVIGWVDAFTGIYAAGVLTTSPAVYYPLIEDVNAKGGLYVPEYGRRLPIELITYDSKSDTETLIRLTEKAMVVDKVDLMFAPWGTSQNFAVLPLYEKYGYPLVAIHMGSDQVVNLIRRGEAKWIFPFLSQPYITGKVVADFLQWANATNIGIIYITDLHGIEHASAVYRELYTRNIFPVIYESYPLTVTDLSPLIKKLKEANVDALFAASYPEDGILLIKQCIELEYSPRIWISGPGTNFPGIMIPIFGAEIIKGIATYHGGMTTYKTPELRAYAERFKKITGGYPPPFIYIAAYQCLLAAVERHSLFDRAKIRDALATETFDTIVGPAGFDLKNCYLDFPKRGELAQWQGGEMMEVIWPLESASSPWIPKPPWPKSTP